MEKNQGEIITKELETYKSQGANILMPSIHISGMSEFHSAIIETVTLSPNPDDGDVYAHDNADEGPRKKWRPTKQALMKLSVCAGVIWSPEQSRRIDNGADRNYIAYRAVGGIKKADGQPVFFSAEYDIDFEVLEEELRESAEKRTKDIKADWMTKKTAKEKSEYVDFCVRRDMLQKRKFKLRLCEAGAMNRVLRMLLGIKQAYTVAELQKPFVMARIVFRPDYNDKEVKKQLIDAHIRSMTGVYGPGSVGTMPEKAEAIDVTPLPEEKDVPEDGKNGAEDPDPIATQVADFEACSLTDKETTLLKLADRKAYKVSDYLAKCKIKGLAQLKPEKLTEFFKHLLSLPDPQETDDIPF